MTEPMPAFHRAKCPACSALCEQRRRSVLLPNLENVWGVHVAYECLECEALYLPDGQALCARCDHIEALHEQADKSHPFEPEEPGHG